MNLQRFCSLLLTAVVLAGATLTPLPAQAKRHYYQSSRYYSRFDHRPMFSYKTGKIIKGSLVGAGIGAGAGLLMDRNVGKTALAGAGIGAGTQAIRYSRTMQRHPIVKTAGYGALAGVGVSALTRRGSLGKGALWGAAAGAGLGALQHL